jgi:hemolysin activation/secretion protein
VEFTGGRSTTFGRGAHVEWRLFAEQQDSASVTQARSLGRKRFEPNILATEGSWAGGALRVARTSGMDPRFTRVFTEARLEAATGETDYGRVSLDLTASRPIGGSVVALTLSGGTSFGTLPPQRRWFLGGPHTVRGQIADTSKSGNAYWLVRGDISAGGVSRLSLFADVGWVRDRTQFGDPGHPLSGVGVGISLFDGLLRLDTARGLYPRDRWRFEMYLGARY